jgi:manganese-dependent inorganic pyrophosphatase
MSDVKVTGHTPVDTDSVCSPIAYAWYLKNIKQIDATPVIGSDINKETKFILDKFNVQKPEIITHFAEGDKLVVIDTSNPKEMLTGFETAEVIEVIDHHKLSGLTTTSPVPVTVKPYGCVATVIFEMMGEAVEQLPKEIAGLMLSSIISDTLKYTSPTTTEMDKTAGAKLAEISGANVDELATGMFTAKSDVSDLTAREIILTDHKDFEFGGKTYKISAIETADPSQVVTRLSELQTEAETIKSENNLAGVCVFIVDIINGNSQMFATTGDAQDLSQKAFGGSWESNGLMNLPGVVSRKKQMVPAYEKAVA